MSALDTDVDLGAFAKSQPASAPAPRKRPWRVLVPLGLLLGFGALFLPDLLQMLRPKVEVSVLRPEPVVLEAEGASPAERAVALQAAGWVEADPYPVLAAAVNGGLVRELLVREGDDVEAGQVLARLVDEELRAARDLARARRNGAESAARAAAQFAALMDERFELALETTETRDRARARLAAKRAEAEHRRQAIAEGDAEALLASGELELQRELKALGAAGARQVQMAEASLVAAKARLEILRADAALAAAEAVEAEAEAVRAEAEFERRLVDRERRDGARAQHEAAASELATATLLEEAAQLALLRTEVRAPARGVVFERLAGPGTGLEPGAAVVALFDPSSLRVRVDVPQGEVHRLVSGQAVEVHSESRPDRPYGGVLARVVPRADLQKVTVEVHVRIEDADGRLLPNMLVQARFLSGGTDAAGGGRKSGEALLVPERVLDGNSLWVLDASGARAVKLAVERGARRGDRIEIRAGLNLSHKVIDRGREGLVEGASVRVLEVSQ